MSKRLTTEQFIEKARKVHGNRYDYSLVNYTGRLIPVKIICPVHGVFEQKPANHFNSGCILCGQEKVGKLNRKTKTDFINSANLVYGIGKYDYSKVVYTTCKIKVLIGCKNHGYFLMTPNKFLKGVGCPKCGFERKSQKRRLTTEQFVKKSIKIHGNKYCYYRVVYKTNRVPVEIICSKHGPFFQMPSKHLEGCGCPMCSQSRGESIITLFLQRNNIKFIPEYKFSGCKYKKELPFDFAIFNNKGELKCLIEYQGQQHFEPVKYFGGLEYFNLRVKKDTIKFNYCKCNKITLYYITYKDDIQQRLKEILNV